MWCCDACKLTEHKNHQTSNLNMKYSGEHNKRHVQITGRHSQLTGNDNKKMYAPRCQLLHRQIKAVKEPPSPLQTTVSYGIILSHGHKPTATSGKRQFSTSNYVHHKIKDSYVQDKSRVRHCPLHLRNFFSLCTELPLLCWLRWRRGEPWPPG